MKHLICPQCKRARWTKAKMFLALCLRCRRKNEPEKKREPRFHRLSKAPKPVITKKPKKKRGQQERNEH